MGGIGTMHCHFYTGLGRGGGWWICSEIEIYLGVLEVVEISEYLVSGCLERLWIIDFLVE